MAKPAPHPAPWWPALAGGALCIALALLDMAWGPDRIISATVVIAPFLTAVLRGTTRQTAAVGALALACCVLSGAWNENFGSVDYLLRVGVVAAGASFAALAARTRVRLDASRARVALIASVGDLIVKAVTLEETVQRLGDALVPAFADLCVVDISRGGETQRLVAGAHGGRAAELEAMLDTADASSLSVTMRAGGRDVGTLGLVRASGRGFGEDDRALARVLAGRAALAFANAGLSTELETAEAQLGAALGSLAEAVTVQDASGKLVYANEAAAAVLGFDSARDLLATPPEEIVERYETFLDDGSPLTLERLPGRRVLAGEHPEPLVVRAIEKATGEEHWRVVKATAVRGPRGMPRMAVNVVEDITEVKRAELTQRLLARAGEVLGSTLDADEALQRLAAETVPQLADWCSAHLVAPSGEIRSAAVAHVDPAMLEFAREYRERWPVQPDDPTGAPAVIRTGVSELMEIPDRLIVESVSDPEQLALLRTLGLRSVMVVPIVGAGAPIGALSFVSAESRRMFVAADLALAEELGRRAGTAIEHARLYEERSRIARTLQTGLLPASLPEISGWASAAMYRAAGEENLVGGDFYDAFAVDQGWMVVVGDVIGRGAEAATLTAVARSTLRATGRLVERPRRGPRPAQPGAARAAGAGPLHRRVPGAARDARRRGGGRRGLRRPSASVARPRGARRAPRALGRAAGRLRVRGVGRRDPAHRAGRHRRALHRRRPGRRGRRRALRRGAPAAGAHRLPQRRGRRARHRRGAHRVPDGRAGRRHGRPGDPAHAVTGPGAARTVSGPLTSRVAATA